VTPLVLYARFIGDTADYVLNQVIEATILKDREFLAWRAELPLEPATGPTRHVIRSQPDHDDAN
jgi:hypothetical protein